MGQRWLIRVASHRRHGGGHVARCAVLASALVDAGADVVVQLDPGALEATALLARHGLSCSEDPVTGPIRGIVLDGYELMGREATNLARRAPLVVIDDFLDPPDCAALAINGAVHLDGDRIGELPALLGPRYALIDPRYAALPSRDRAAPVRNVLITMGRLDPDNLVITCLDLLDAIGCEAQVTVVASSDTVGRAGLDTRIQRPHRLVIDAADMVPLLDDADFVIGAGGVSLMERMAAGVPSMTFSLIDNQRLFVRGAADLGATVDGGDPSSPECATLLREIFADGPARVAMAAAGRRVIDGQGAARVASHLIDFATDVRGPERNTMQGLKA
jgi:spore coat polysaccharide biosynthesis predicted glycosyltransferase SpsG